MHNPIRRLMRKASNLRIVDMRCLFRYWEPLHLSTFLKFFEIDCIFDVGANEGQYATMLRHAAGYRGRIISFEPNPIAAQRVQQISARDPLWDVEKLALSSANGQKAFNIMRDSQFSSFSKPSKKQPIQFERSSSIQETILAKTETLTTAYERLARLYGFRRPFLKLDTQGHDVDIVRHAGPALSEFVGLQSELAVKKIYEESVDFREALTLYEAKGFCLSAFVPNNAGHFPILVETDCIMVRRDLVEAKSLNS